MISLFTLRLERERAQATILESVVCLLQRIYLLYCHLVFYVEMKTLSKTL